MQKYSQNKNILVLLFTIFFIGGIGGIFFNRFFMPLFETIWPFSVLKTEESGPAVTFINKKQEIFIKENAALEEAINRVKSAVVKIEVENYGKPEVFKDGTGFFVTDDGLLLAPYDVVKNGKVFIIRDGKRLEAKLFKYNSELNLASLFVKDGRFSSVSFAPAEDLKLGERIFLLVMGAREQDSPLIVADGIIKSIQKNLIDVSGYDKSDHGAPIFNIEGKLIGMLIVSQNDFAVLPLALIHSFLGF